MPKRWGVIKIANWEYFKGKIAFEKKKEKKNHLWKKHKQYQHFSNSEKYLNLFIELCLLNLSINITWGKIFSMWTVSAKKCTQFCKYTFIVPRVLNTRIAKFLLVD